MLGNICWPVASKRRGGGRPGSVGLTGVVKARVLLVSRCLERQGPHWASQAPSGSTGQAPGDGMCCSSPRTATVSAWHPGALHPPPPTSPGSVGMSRPRLQPSSRDPSSKSRRFACSLTGTRRLEQLLAPFGWLWALRGAGLRSWAGLGGREGVGMIVCTAPCVPAGALGLLQGGWTLHHLG